MQLSLLEISKKVGTKKFLLKNRNIFLTHIHTESINNNFKNQTRSLFLAKKKKNKNKQKNVIKDIPAFLNNHTSMKKCWKHPLISTEYL